MNSRGEALGCVVLPGVGRHVSRNELLVFLDERSESPPVEPLISPVINPRFTIGLRHVVLSRAAGVSGSAGLLDAQKVSLPVLNHSFDGLLVLHVAGKNPGRQIWQLAIAGESHRHQLTRRELSDPRLEVDWQ